MAKLPASKALEAYKVKQINNLSSTLQERTASLRKRRGSISFKEEDEVKPPKPSEILREYKAQIEMGKIREREMERARTGMSRTEFEDYEDTVKTQKTLAKTLATEGRAAERVKATALAKEEKETEEKRVEDKAIQKKIAEGSGFLPSLIKGQFPQTNTTFGNASDITIIVDPLDAPDRTQTKAYFTLEDIDFMIKNNEFENAEISRETVTNALKINPETGVMKGSLLDVQTLIFDFLQTPYGKGMATAQRMTYKDPSIITAPVTIQLPRPSGK